MIGKKIEASAAAKAAVNNPGRIFAVVSKDGKSGFERSHGDVIQSLYHSPKFKLSRSDKFFTIGSCFARNIEKSLVDDGIFCITSKCVIPDNLYERTGIGARNGALNAYTPGAMRDLVRLASRSDKETAAILKVGDGEYCDMLTTGLRFMSEDEASFVRSKLIDTYSDLPSADVVVLTLGYTESWFDEESGIFANRSPTGNIKLTRNNARFRFENLTSSSSCSLLRESIEHIKSASLRDVKIIVTVSPVPLHATFTEIDVIRANDYSKSALLAAAEECASSYDYVDYFPSYQYVKYTNPSYAWDNDGVHVKQSLVDRIIGKFSDMYFSY